MYWDVHCHLTDPRWQNDIEGVLAEASDREIKGFGLGGYDPEEWQRQLDLKRRFPQYSIVPVFGLHPMWVSQETEETLELGLDRLIHQCGQAKAIGEIGLDARKEYIPGWVKQMEAYRSQLEIAGMLKKPVILHVVRSHPEALQILTLHKEILNGGFIHAFHGDISTAKQYLSLDLAISIGGAVTHSKSDELKKVVRWLPKESLLLETDSPDQKVKNWPSSLHRPVALWNIAEVVAELRGETTDSVLQQSAENFCRILRV